MPKFLILPLLFVGGALLAAPSTYNIPKLPDGFEPTIDGNLSDWTGNPAYLLDSIRSDANVYVESEVSEPWTRADFQYYLYAAWNDQKIFFAAKVVADDIYNNCHNNASLCDNMKINFMGKGTAFYLFPDNNYKPNPSCPWTLGTSLWYASNPTGYNGQLPVYEWALDRNITAPSGAISFQLSTGTEEVDGTTTCSGDSGVCRDQTFVCVGAEGPLDKQDWGGSGWDNGQYWPTFILTSPDSPTTHVFWYKCIQNNYNLQDSQGPNLPSSVIRHEGMIVSATLRPTSSSYGPPTFDFGKPGGVGSCYPGLFWSNDLNISTGTCSRALLRAEYRDGWSTRSFCSTGPIKFRYGIATFAGNILAHGATWAVPEKATWADGLLPLICTMGFDTTVSFLEQEDSVVFQVPAGRTSETSPSVLDKTFLEFDVTRQVNWILSHTQPAHKESVSFALVLLANQSITSGTFYTYSSEDRILPTPGSDSPWTHDGNTMHLVVESDNLQVVSSEANHLSPSLPGLGRIYPNPFKSGVTIEFNAAAKSKGLLTIYSLDGKKVFSTATNGTGAVVWSPKNVASGIYLCRLLSGNAVYSKSLLLSR